jgi:hypothetical protein
MLPVDIEEVGPNHIAALVSEKVAERKLLEYKEKLPEGTDGAKKEFLADVCSFANSSGGDIVFGIRDQRDSSGKATGVPEAVVGLANANLSAERERLEAIIRDGIKPRIPQVQTREVGIQGQGPVVLLRVGKSWIKPHMVSYGGTSRFYSRHSSGKYQLDVQEIGQAFAEQRSLGEQLRNWRADRIAHILSDEGPMLLDGPSKLLLHFVPASALAGPQTSGLWPVPNDVRNLFRPSSLSSSTAWRYNADGFLVYSLKGADACASYVQMFRNGCLEYGDGYILNVGNQRGRLGDIPSQAFEEKLVAVFGTAVLALNRLGVEDPVYFSCTLVGVQGSTLSRDGVSFYEVDVQHKFDRQVVQSPEIQIGRNEPAPYLNSLLPIVDSIWQANGYEETPWLKKWGLDRNRRPISRE